MSEKLLDPAEKQLLEEQEHHHHEHSEVSGCEHDHEHEHHHHHEHGEACGCGHDHEHEHHHDHEHGEACGCGHDHEHHHHHEHGEACGCGHNHEHEHHHHHEHGEACGCGHDHDHEHHHHHEHGEACGCGHDHEHEHHHERKMPETGKMKRVYILDNLGCAHCASKMEDRINELPGVECATITYATKQLRVSADDPDELLPQFQEICASIEPDVKVIPREPASGGQAVVFLLENLGCAHCASKMEDRINELPGVAEATITFATKQLRITGRSPESLLPELQRICTSIEPEVRVTLREAGKPGPERKEAEKQGKLSENTRESIEIAVGAALFAAGLLLRGSFGTAAVVCFLLGYVVLGGKIILTALKNLSHGQLTDENFLMSLATIAAIAIKDYPEACGVMLFYRVGELFEHIAVERSRSQIMQAVDLRPEVVNLIEGDSSREIPAQDAVVGDVVLVRPGDRIPLDGVIVSGESRIDTSPVTGEPVPVSVREGDAVVSGCMNTSGLLQMRVEKPLSESMVTRILDSVENAAASKPKIDRFITRFAHVYTPVVVLLALATAILPSLVTGDWNHWIYTAITFLVISCPCALVLSVPLAFFSGIGAGSKRGILFKGGVALEAMKGVKAVVMDKTGTITEGNFVVQSCVPSNGIDEVRLLALAAGCEAGSTHPIAHSIVSAAEQRGIAVLHPQSVREISGWGIEAVFAGGKALCGSRKLLESEQIDLSAYQSDVYGTEVLLALNGKFIGHLVISDTIKPEARDAIGTLNRRGLITAMLTGDAQASAESVAAETGVRVVHAGLLPEQKLSALQKIRGEHGAAMFVGDGINDAPVLAGADVGAAMGSGADAAIEAADVVFMTSSMNAIPQSLEIARVTGRIAWQNVVFALAVKAFVMVLGLAGMANMWMAVFADTGVAMICVMNSIRVLYRK